MNREDFFGVWSRNHGNAEIKGIVRGWLIISFWLTRPIIKLRITPNALTISSIVLGLAFVRFIDSNFAIALLALSLALDGIDGTVAMITGRVTRFGALLDAFADRVVEALWAYGLFLMGAPWKFVIIAWLASSIQEYMRARSTGLGIQDLLIVTPAERPVRASFIFIALVARAVGIDLIAPIAAIWALLQILSAIWLLSALRSQLRRSQH